MARDSDIAGEDVHILVAAAGEIEDHDFIFFHFGGAVDQLRQRVRGFERGNNSFDAGESARCLDGFFVGDGGVFGAAFVGEPGVLGADGGIIEAGGNGMGGCDLSIGILQQVGVCALQDAGARACETLPGGEARGMFAE